MDKQSDDRSEIEMDALLERESKSLDCVSKMRKMAQKAIKSKGLSESEVRKTLGIKRYEK